MKEYSPLPPVLFRFRETGYLPAVLYLKKELPEAQLLKDVLYSGIEQILQSLEQNKKYPERIFNKFDYQVRLHLTDSDQFILVTLVRKRFLDIEIGFYDLEILLDEYQKLSDEYQKLIQ